MKITYEDAVYEFDVDDITVKQAMAIEKHIGAPYEEWDGMLRAGGKFLALQALGWLILKGGELDEHGKPVIPLEDVDFKLVRFGEALEAAQAAQAATAVAAEPASTPDPTGATTSAQPDMNGQALVAALSASSSAVA